MGSKAGEMRGISEVLERIRVGQDLTQAEMAARIGISQGQYSILARGLQEPTLPKIFQIMRAVPETRAIFFAQVIQPTKVEFNEETGSRIGWWSAELCDEQEG